MDKNSLKRRNRLLKKNESRMNILLGKSVDDNISQNNNNNDNLSNDKIYEQFSNNMSENIERKILNNVNNKKKIINENTDYEKNNNCVNMIDNNSNNFDYNKNVDNENYEDNEKQKNINDKIKNVKEDYLGSKKEILQEDVNFNHNENMSFNVIKDKNINYNSLKERSEFNINNMKKLHFSLLIILSILFSFIKLNYNNILLYNNIGKQFLYFIKSNNFFIYFSIIYNVIFLLFDIFLHCLKNNIRKKDLIENIKNVKKKLINESEFFLFIINNMLTVLTFLISIIKSYVVSIFLTYLFHDIFYNNIFYISSMNLNKKKHII
ncbi:conserved Plasmodium protein, unknown function [Plasmodium gallinaceum]|uniref:Uncharacterized protein n=1 Tax=Plasmodium gallinaceum TaxID=5849 RepID=A0A1J1GPZ1_PLAGA|nr:conserved Plasmodium protein, unknown function [Plasmodium gallinaceum]CRG94358.1 conserved Plasmodium protein, unknown function [Plasmodium gallinaceum]